MINIRVSIWEPSLALYFPWPLFRQKQQFDSVIYWSFLWHNMFRPSGPDHVLATTGQIWNKPHRKWMWGLGQTKTKGSAEKVKVKALYKRNLRYCFRKEAPQGLDCPSPPCPQAPPCRDQSPPLATVHLPLFPGPSGHHAHGGAWQHTWWWVLKTFFVRQK